LFREETVNVNGLALGLWAPVRTPVKGGIR
jgi:hypothetical protein